MNKYYESQYDVLDAMMNQNGGLSTFGPMSSFTWNNDPKRLLFVLSRYKTTAKLLENQDSVLEIGCGDAFGSRIVKQHVKDLTVSDIDPKMIEAVKYTYSKYYPIKTLNHNFLINPTFEKFSAAYLLDVLEHIDISQEDIFIKNIIKSLRPNGVLIIGMPSLESQLYASEESKKGHINCKRMEDLKKCMEKYFNNVFMFSMNDEVLHTGFSRMSNYIFSLCVSSKL